jgi:BspA type Leucine rich repeat region (6 copies)
MNQKSNFPAGFLILVLLGLPGALEGEDFTYETNNDTITITGYTGVGGDVTIPGTVNDLPVISIGYRAFYRCTKLTSIAIPNTVTSIGGAAFLGCTNLTSVRIPDSVTGSDAFSSCS